MAKQSAIDAHRNGRTRDHSRVSGSSARRGSKGFAFVEITDTRGVKKCARRDILFPSEPSTIGHKKIDRAIELVVSRKKK